MKKTLVILLLLCLISISAQAASVQYTLEETAPGSWDIYVQVTGTDTLGLSAYALWVYDITPGTVSYQENTLKTVDENFNSIGFATTSVAEYNNYPVGSGKTALGIGNYQNVGSAILGVGLTEVDEPGGFPGLSPHVQLGVPAYLGTISTPEGLGLEGKPAGVSSWASPDFGLDYPGASLINLTGDGYLFYEEFDVTYLVTPYVEPVIVGDANQDGVVSAGDFACVQANFGSTGDPGILGDANQDGAVSAGDYSCVQTNFGSSSGAGTVPEPASLAVLALSSLTIFRRKKNRKIEHLARFLSIHAKFGMYE